MYAEFKETAMRERLTINGMQIDKELHDFIVNEALPGTGVDADAFFQGHVGDHS